MHTGWFGLSALIVGETVRVEPVDVVVQLDADVAVLDAAGCDAMTDMIERKDIRRALRGVDLLRTLSDTEIEALTLEVSPIVVEVGETIIAAGDSLGGADDAFYIIHRGEFEVRDRKIARLSVCTGAITLANGVCCQRRILARRIARARRRRRATCSRSSARRSSGTWARCGTTSTGTTSG